MFSWTNLTLLFDRFVQKPRPLIEWVNLYGSYWADGRRATCIDSLGSDGVIPPKSSSVECRVANLVRSFMGPYNYLPNLPITVSPHSRMNRSLSAKCTLIQKCVAPASAAVSILRMQSSTVPAIANRSAR